MPAPPRSLGSKTNACADEEDAGQDKAHRSAAGLQKTEHRRTAPHTEGDEGADVDRRADDHCRHEEAVTYTEDAAGERGGEPQPGDLAPNDHRQRAQLEDHSLYLSKAVGADAEQRPIAEQQGAPTAATGPVEDRRASQGGCLADEEGLEQAHPPLRDAVAGQRHGEVRRQGHRDATLFQQNGEEDE
jgi:hypothetical protein